jgi:hypothetical protein
MRKLVFVSVILLTACGPKWGGGSNEANSPENENVAGNSANATSATNTSGNAAQSDEGAYENAAESSNALGSLPPADLALRFIGLWATDKANCAAHGWRFTSGALTEPDGSRCSFYKVTKMPGGYDLAARCPAKKPDELDLIKLRFAESARAMLVESNAIKPTGLLYCGK